MKRYIKLHHPKKNNYNSKNGFSLAEAMVMLVVIAILLAVSAPLIAKKSNADQRRLVVQSGINPVTAMGNNQNFGIGTNNPNAKLHVRANRLLANFVSTIAGNGDNANTTEIFQVIPGSNAANQNGFKVFADGTTNVRTCVPDYENASDSILLTNYEVLYNATGAGPVIPVTEDGYYVTSRSLAVYYNQAKANANNPDVLFNPAVTILTNPDRCDESATPKICGQKELTVSGSKVQISGMIHRFLDSIIVPVSAGNYIKPYRAEGTADLVDKVFFVPCAKPTR